MNGWSRTVSAGAGRTVRYANVLKKEAVMGLHRIVARSSQAFKFIFDPDTYLVSRAQIDELDTVKRQLAEVRQKLDESQKTLAEKDGLIAQLQEQLAAQAQEKKTTSRARAKKPTSTRKRTTTKKSAVEGKTPAKSKTATQPGKRAKTQKAKPVGTRTTAKKAVPKTKTGAKAKRSPRTR